MACSNDGFRGCLALFSTPKGLFGWILACLRVVWNV